MFIIRDYLTHPLFNITSPYLTISHHHHLQKYLLYTITNQYHQNSSHLLLQMTLSPRQSNLSLSLSISKYPSSDSSPSQSPSSPYSYSKPTYSHSRHRSCSRSWSCLLPSPSRQASNLHKTVKGIKEVEAEVDKQFPEMMKRMKWDLSRAERLRWIVEDERMRGVMLHWRMRG